MKGLIEGNELISCERLWFLSISLEVNFIMIMYRCISTQYLLIHYQAQIMIFTEFI